MRATPLLLVCIAGTAGANADGPTPPPATDETLISGPFGSPRAYCEARARDAGGASCELSPDHGVEAATLPVDRANAVKGITAVRFILVDTTWHVVMQTSRGWFGRAFENETNGDAVSIEKVRWNDLVGDGEPELYFEHTLDHEPCGCEDDLFFVSRFASVCTAGDDGRVRCSEPVRIARNDHGADIVEWTADWKIGRDGTVTPTISGTVGVSKRELRALKRPFKLRFL